MVHAYVYYSCLGSLDYSLLSLYITDHTLHTTLYRGWVTTAINQLSCPFRLLLSIVNILMTYPDYDPQLILLPKLTNLKRNVAPVCFVYSSIFPPKVAIPFSSHTPYYTQWSHGGQRGVLLAVGRAIRNIVPHGVMIFMCKRYANSQSSASFMA